MKITLAKTIAKARDLILKRTFSVSVHKIIRLNNNNTVQISHDQKLVFKGQRKIFKWFSRVLPEFFDTFINSFLN